MSRSYTSSPPSASTACSGTVSLYKHEEKLQPNLLFLYYLQYFLLQGIEVHNRIVCVSVIL
jgi:hypothetical protein